METEKSGKAFACNWETVLVFIADSYRVDGRIRRLHGNTIVRAIQNIKLKFNLLNLWIVDSYLQLQYHRFLQEMHNTPTLSKALSCENVFL